MVHRFAEWLQSTQVSVTIQSVDWLIPTIQSVHILTIGVVFVSLLVVALRVMGSIRTDEPFDHVMNRFAPRIRIGLAVLAVTGITLIVGEPVRELMSLSFWLKMALLAVAIASATGFRRSVARAVTSGTGNPEFSLRAKWAAGATVVLWLAIIFLGRAIAYDVEVWGPLSLSPRA